ncbi:MAG: orotidine 5'-phosphate decarboxylase / HUMPS family protein [Candidatus Babeliales bacterium]
MKLVISYNIPNLAKALELAQQTASYANIIGLGSALILKEGVHALTEFKTAFPSKELFVEAKIIEKAEECVTMFASAGASYLSLLAGAHTSVIKKAVTSAKNCGLKLALDLVDAPSMGQSALDAKMLGVNSIIAHRGQSQEEISYLENNWLSIAENTNLPLFISGKIDENSLQQVIDLKPFGIIIGSAIIKANNPVDKAKLFYDRITAL